WWFGPKHRAAFRSVFDELFREHLRMAWAAMGMDAPAELTQPIMNSESAGSTWGAMHPATAPTRSRRGGSASELPRSRSVPGDEFSQRSLFSCGLHQCYGGAGSCALTARVQEKAACCTHRYRWSRYGLRS